MMARMGPQPSLFCVLGIGTALFMVINLCLFVIWFPFGSYDDTHDPVMPTMIQHSKQNSKSMVHKTLLAAGFDEKILLERYDELPSDVSIIQLYGAAPIVLGLETCEVYRTLVPPQDRMLGAAGMFSTGTNLITQLLKRNCVIPERAKLYGINASKEELGMRWQVPWGKHTPASFREQHHASEKAASVNKDYVLPIVTIRNPWRWMQSMCRNPYAASWPHFRQCPNLLQSDNLSWNEVTVKYGVASVKYPSLAHLWNDWYRSYLNTSLLGMAATSDRPKKYPWLMVRMEDLTFYTEETTTLICQCAGGQIKDPFVYVADSAKADSPGHDTSTGILEAWIKYSRSMPPGAGFSDTDYHAAQNVLDHDILDMFQYTGPPPI